MRRRWLTLSLATLALAAVLHVAFVWFLPHAIMQIFMSRLAGLASVNRVVAPPLPTDTSRTVVTPSPDLLYGTCVFDITHGPVRVTLRPPSTYWSLALFDTNTDNVFKLNATDIESETAEIVLGSASDIAAVKADFPSAKLVQPPHASGVMLARILVLDKSNMAEALAAQKSVSCDTIKKSG
jgi:uncharacterized membrane protein